MKPQQEIALAARHPAQNIVENTSAAYWLFSKGADAVSTGDFLMKDVHESFRELAKALGYDIAKIAETEGLET